MPDRTNEIQLELLYGVLFLFPLTPVPNSGKLLSNLGPASGGTGALPDAPRLCTGMRDPMMPVLEIFSDYI
jgi:hypothetical protein